VFFSDWPDVGAAGFEPTARLGSRGVGFLPFPVEAKEAAN